MYAAAAAIVVEDRGDLAQGVALLGDPDGQVRTIEAEHELLGVAAAQDLDDVAPGRRVGGRREGRDRDPGKARPQLRQGKVFRTEGMPPAADEMGFVDDQP